MSSIQFRDDAAKSGTSGEASCSDRKGKSVIESRLSRVRSVSISRISNDDNVGVHKLSLRSRRVRMSDDVHPVSRNSTVMTVRARSDTAREGIQASKFAQYDLLKEKCSLNRHLRSLHNVLQVCLSNSSKNFNISKTVNGYRIHTSRQEIQPQTTIHLLQLIRRAVDLEVEGVYSDHGRWISMSDFLQKIKELFERNDAFKKLMDERNYDLLEKTVSHFTKVEKGKTKRRSLKSLKLPLFARDLPKNEKAVVHLLQRIYPGGNDSKGYIDPVTLILVYPRYVSTQRFFELAKLMLGEPERRVPRTQKHRIINLCRTWVSRKYHPDQIKNAKVLTRIHHIINLGLLSEDPFQVELAHELSSCIVSAPLHVREYRMVDGKASLHECIAQLNKKNLKEIAELIASDCYTMSRATILNIPLYELLIKSDQAQFSNMLVERFEQLSNFVKTSILDSAGDGGAEEPFRHLSLRIKLWMEVAVRLMEKGDFSFGLAVVSGLSNSAISRLISNEKVNGFKRGYKPFSKNELKTWASLCEFFSPIGDFKEMKALMKFRQKEGKSVIPYLGLFSRYLMHSNDGNKEEKDGVINVEKLHIIGNILASFWDDLTKLRSEAEKGVAVIHLKTDWMDSLKSVEKMEDSDLWKISETLKPFKTT